MDEATEGGRENAERVGDLALAVEVVDFLSGYRVSGMLESLTPGEVVVSLAEPLSEQREASVCLHSFVFDGQVLYCQPRESGYEAHITIDDAEENGLRRAPRFPVKLRAQLFPPHATPVDVTIVDISSTGLGIELPRSLKAGQTIAVASESVFVFGIVRHCRKLSGGVFRAGVEMLHLFEKRLEASRAGMPGHRSLWAWGKRPKKASPTCE